MTNLPDYVTSYQILKSSFVHEHSFCSYCGKEITKFNFRNGNLKQRQHFLCTTTTNLNLKMCWRRDKCVERRLERGLDL